MNMFTNYSIDALKSAEAIMVPHTRFTAALDRLHAARHLAAAGADPRRFLLIGEAGSGKTLLGLYFKSLFPLKEVEGVMRSPVLYIETPASPTLKSFAESMLIALGDPFAHRGTAYTKQVRALELIDQLKVEFIVIDEFQHFLDHGHGRSLGTVADWFKSLINKTSVPCLLMGLPRCEAILQANEQLRRRFSEKLELPTFSLDSKGEEAEFIALLKAVNAQLKIKLHQLSEDQNLTRRIYFATNGRISYIKKLIVSALELSLAQDASYIDQSLLEEAFVHAIWSGGGKKLNPFNESFVFRALDRAGEPFYLSMSPRKSSEAEEVVQ